jgi:hypothetical protein
MASCIIPDERYVFEVPSNVTIDFTQHDFCVKKETFRNIKNTAFAVTCSDFKNAFAPMAGYHVPETIKANFQHIFDTPYIEDVIKQKNKEDLIEEHTTTFANKLTKEMEHLIQHHGDEQEPSKKKSKLKAVVAEPTLPKSIVEQYPKTEDFIVYLQTLIKTK